MGRLVFVPVGGWTNDKTVRKTCFQDVLPALAEFVASINGSLLAIRKKQAS